MKIYVVRHGETALNSKGVLQGWLDEPLNENGRYLATLSGKAMKGIHFDYCISSPFVRATETAKIILRESGNAVDIKIDDRIREINFGDFEGKSLSEMEKNCYSFYADPFNFKGFTNGENIKDLCDRTQAFLKELISKDDGKVYLISTHGCAMRAMINYLKEDPSDYWCSRAPYNCSFTIVETKNGTPTKTDVDKVFYDKNLIVDYFKKP